MGQLLELVRGPVAALGTVAGESGNPFSIRFLLHAVPGPGSASPLFVGYIRDFEVKPWLAKRTLGTPCLAMRSRGGRKLKIWIKRLRTHVRSGSLFRVYQRPLRLPTARCGTNHARVGASIQKSVCRLRTRAMAVYARPGARRSGSRAAADSDSVVSLALEPLEALLAASSVSSAFCQASCCVLAVQALHTQFPRRDILQSRPPRRHRDSEPSSRSSGARSSGGVLRRSSSAAILL